MTLLTSTALAILGGIFAALLAFGGVRAAWRGFAGRRGTFAALCVLAAFCAILADKPTPVPSALLRWDRGLADNGSIATNDTVFIRGTYDPLMANDALHVDYRDRTITDSPDGWARAYDGAVGDLADGFTVTIPDATNMVVWIWSEYVEPAPTHTNGEYRIIYVGRIDGGAADAPRYVTPRTPIVASSEIIPVEYLESTGTQWIDTGYVYNADSKFVCDAMLMSVPSDTFATMFGAVQNYNGVFLALNNTVPIQARFGANSVGNIVSDLSVQNAVGVRHKYELSARRLAIDDDVFTRSGFTPYTVNRSIWLCSCNDSESGNLNKRPCSLRVYTFAIYNGNALVRDFIPVRVGTTSAAYDKRGVGGMNGDGTARNDGLYFNRGTGDFVCGPDVRNGSAILSPPSLPPPAQSLFSTLATENLTE